MNHDGEGAERHESRHSMCKTRAIMMDQVQNEMNHDEAGAKRGDSRRSRCKTRGITTKQVQNEVTHEGTDAKRGESRWSRCKTSGITMCVYIYIYKGLGNETAKLKGRLGSL